MDVLSSISEEPIYGNRTNNRGRQRGDGRGEGYRGRGGERNHGGRGYRGRGGEGNHGGRGNRGRGERHNGRGWRRGNRGRGRGQIVENENFNLPDEGITNSQQNQTPENIPSVDSNRVLHYLVNCCNGSCIITDLQKHSGLFPSDSTSETVSQSLNRCRNVRVLINEGNHGLSRVRVIMTSLRLCFRHAPPKPCNRGACRHIHLCRDFIMDCCYRRNCICSHNVDSEHNSRLLAECGAEIFNTIHKLVLIKSSNMMVCSDFNNPTGCADQSSCFRLHICSAFVMNRCLIPNNECREGHDLWTDRNRKILKLYGADHLPEETIFKMLLAIRKRPQSFSSRMAGLSLDFHETEIPIKTELVPVPEMTEEMQEHSTQNAEVIYSHITDEESSILTSEHVAESEKMTSPEKKIVKFTDYLNSKYEPLPQHDVTKNVCEVFEEHKCNDKNNCTDRHDSHTPYLWRVKIDGEWRSLEKSSSIEKAFCDPNNNEFFDVESIPNTYIQIDFEQMNSNVGRVQRLTTPSYVNCRDQADSTIWQWYWNDSLTSNANWISYATNGNPPYQDILEQKYLKDPKLVCCFEIGRFLYELSFATMMQTNLQTQRKRKVRRRPIFQNKAEWSKARLHIIEYHCDLHKLPDDWVPMDTESRAGTELVPLHRHDDSYRDIKHKFFTSMDATKHKIKGIYRLQNLELWTSYQTKKETIDKHMGMETEVMVYHGTAKEETTRWICGIGFDQRMQGVNGTVYGKGAYFATTAKYSHNFTKPSPRNNFRYMFYAKITIGKVAKGDSSMKRPPPIDEINPKKGLHDSCANDIRNPSIYVIFDNSQTYPAYLIEYKDISNEATLVPLPSAFRPVGQAVSGPFAQNIRPIPVTGYVANSYSANLQFLNSSSQLIPQQTSQASNSNTNHLLPSNQNLPVIPPRRYLRSPPPPVFPPSPSPPSSPIPSPPSSPTPPMTSSNSVSTSNPTSSASNVAPPQSKQHGCTVM